MSKQVMQRALDALTGVLDDDKDVRKASITGGLYEVVDCRQAIAELRAEIAKPEMEPVGHFYFDRDDFTYKQAMDKISFPACIKLYAAPPDTEAMLNNLSNAASMFQSYVNGNTSMQMAQATINALNAFIDKQGGGE